MIKFSSSFKLKEVHTVDSPFNKDPNFGEGRPENLRKMDNNRDIYCHANWGW